MHRISSQGTQLCDWMKNSTTDTVQQMNIGYLESPARFLDALLQATARTQNISVDELEIFITVALSTNPEASAFRGVLLVGMCLVGVQYDDKSCRINLTDGDCLRASAQAPVLLARAVLRAESESLSGNRGVDSVLLSCPIYASTDRSIAPFARAHLPCSSVQDSHRAILRGIALIAS